MAKPIIRRRRGRRHLIANTQSRTIRPSQPSARIPSIDRAALRDAIDAQRSRLFEATAILACLGAVLDDIYVPGSEDSAPDLEHVADALIRMLDSIAAQLDPTGLQLGTTERVAEDRPALP